MKPFADLHPKVVLGVAAHPDDLEFGAAGTIAQFAQAGAKAYYLILTDGSQGSEDRAMTPEHLKATRQAEQRAAGKALGLTDVFFMDYPDGGLENTREVRRDIVRVIRQVKPDVLITWDPSVLYAPELGFINHPDHRAAGQAALDATFPLARDHMAFPELLEEGLEPHKVATVLLMNLAQHNYAVDVTGVFDRKLQALAAHTSQIADLAATTALVTEWAQAAAKSYSYDYGEAFMRVDIS